MTDLKLLLSFDHELTLGGTRSFARNLFEPTDLLLETADELSVPLVFFTDVLCAIRFEEWDGQGFCKPYRDQLRRAAASGHDVQLHLHPHWLDSEYRDGSFIPANSYSLGEFADRSEPNSIAGIVRRGIAYLEALCREADPNYKCVAYRAGGFALVPHTERILAALYENGIRIESSVVKDFRFHTKVCQVDFRDMPSRANWFIAPSGPVNRAAEAGLFEIPIAACPRSPVNNLPFLVKRVLHKDRAHKSGGWGLHDAHTSVLTKLGRLFPRSAWMLGFDDYTRSAGDLMKILNRHIKRHRAEEEIICCAISHPKSMGAYARSLLKDFVRGVRDQFGSRAKFCTCRQIYDSLGLGN